MLKPSHALILIPILVLLTTGCPSNKLSKARIVHKTNPETPTQTKGTDVAPDFLHLSAPYVERFSQTAEPAPAESEADSGAATTPQAKVACLIQPLRYKDMLVDEEHFSDSLNFSGALEREFVLTKTSDSSFNEVAVSDGKTYQANHRFELKGTAVTDFPQVITGEYPSLTEPPFHCQRTFGQPQVQREAGIFQSKDGQMVKAVRLTASYISDIVCGTQRFPEVRVMDIVIRSREQIGMEGCDLQPYLLRHREYRLTDGKVILVQHSEILGFGG